MIELISQPWAWYISGPLLALVMFLLLWFGGEFGASSTMRTICAIGGAGKKISFFNFDWKGQTWNIIFVLGAVIGGYIAATFLPSALPPQISAATINDLKMVGISYDGQIAPTNIFAWQSLFTLKGFIVIVGGGFLVGFGLGVVCSGVREWWLVLVFCNIIIYIYINIYFLLSLGLSWYIFTSLLS